VKELVDVFTVRMVMEEGESEDVALTVHEEGPEEGEDLFTNVELGPPTPCPWDLPSQTSSTSGTSCMC